MSDFLERISQLSPKRLALLAMEQQAKIEELERSRAEPLAIVGMSCRFPGGAESPAAFWQMLRDGVDAITEVDPSRWNLDDVYNPDPAAPGKIATRWGGFLSNVDQFDPAFFGIAPREAISMDPQQRLMLEVGWEALEDAGYSPDKLIGSATGVFVGVCNGDYFHMQLEQQRDQVDMYVATGSAHSVAAGRLSYVLGLQGPSIAFDTACSSSLVAVHEACQSLRRGECRMALAGGVNLILSPDTTITLSKANMMSPDGRCKAFDASADGFVRSEGCGLIVLKCLSDAVADGDHILAVIRGTAVNQDGRSNGLTAPNGPSQVAVIQHALADASVKPSELSYVETHGTGTSLGDPIEVQALSAALSEGRSSDAPVMIGSVKTNIGHAEAAAGIAGLIKTVLALQHREIPPHLHLKQLNPHVAWDELVVTIPTRLTPWQPIEGRRVAGVSSFGFSGTNAHLIVEEAPVQTVSQNDVERPWHIIALSGKSDAALGELAARYARHLAAEPKVALGDLAHTVNVGRAQFTQRLAVVAQSTEQVQQALKAYVANETADAVVKGAAKGQRPPAIAFLFTGQGAQYLNMGRQLYETQPTFRRTMDRCAEILRPYLGESLISIIYPNAQARTETSTSKIDETAVTQPALFVIEYALAELWKSWGIEPSVVVGHSAGEYVAACVAGVFSLEDGLKLIAERGCLMQSLPPNGEMAAVFAGEARVNEAIAPYRDRVSIAAINWQDSVVISGERSAVELVVDKLRAGSIRSRRLAISIAGHSPLLDPLLDPFEAIAAGVIYATPQIDMVSSVTGQLAGSEVASAAYWRRNVREAVRFADCMRTVHQQGIELFVEIGPSPTLLGMAQRCLPDGFGTWLPSLRPGTEDWQQMLMSLGTLYTQGVEVDWAGFDRDHVYQRVSLPTYPFQRERYWFDQKTTIDDKRSTIDRRVLSDADHGHPLLGQRLTSPVIKDVVFETRLNTQWPSFLDQHRIFGLAILPSPAYIEMALAAAKQAFGAEHPALEDLMIHEALLLPDDGVRTIQLIMTAPHEDRVSFQVFARVDGNRDWTLHATGRVNLSSCAADSAALAIDDVKTRCTIEISGEDYYAHVHELGLEFGPKFRGITRLWRRDGEALGLIQLRDDLSAEAGQYRMHPALLDACFHLLGAPLPQTDDPTSYLLIGLDRFVLHRAPGIRLWNHTVLRSPDGLASETFTGDIRLFDDEGNLIAEAVGLHLKRVNREALHRVVHRPHVSDWLYEVRWQLKPNRLDTLLLPPAQIAERVQPTLVELADQYGLDIYRQLLPELDALAADYVTQALQQQLGWQPKVGDHISIDSLAERLSVSPQHRRWLTRWLAMLEEDGVLKREAIGWKVITALKPVNPEVHRNSLENQYPQAEAELALMGRCGSQLARVLRGEVDAVNVLFPNGSTALTEPLYRNAPYARAANALVQRVIMVALANQTGPLRVLEIGAGTGATTSQLLPMLPADRTQYTFTDVSPLFLARAEEKFRAYDFVQYQLLDIERDPIEQKFAAQSFDLIIAANVLHATRDLCETVEYVKQLLAPHGLLALLEGTESQRWVDMTFGLTDGWWHFADIDLRPAYPLLSSAQWIDLLTALDFREPQALPLMTSNSEAIGQSVIVASAPVTAGNWLIVGDQSKVGQHLVALLETQGEYARMVSSDEAERCLGGTPYRGIVDLTSLDIASSDAENAAAMCDHTMRLTQAMIHSRTVSKLWLVSRGAQTIGLADEVSALASSTLWGLGRGISAEHPELWGGLIDLPAVEAGIDEATQVLIDILNPDGEDQVAWREGKRYVPRLVRKRDLSLLSEPWPVARDGAYVITGGLGGLGLKIAEWLVRRGARHLVLIGRSGSAGSDADRKAVALKAIEALGATLTIVSADIADRSQMQSLFDRFGRDLPALRGVIHAAVAMSASPIDEMSIDILHAMLRAKVDGTQLLHELTRDLKLDFFVMFSSTTALWGARGLAHYAAANTYLDAMAHYRHSQGLPALTINWGTWSEMRAASPGDQESFVQFGLQPMPNEEALAALGALLRQDVNQIVVAAVDWRTLKAAYEAKRPRPFLSLVDAAATPTHTSQPEARPKNELPLLKRIEQAQPHERREIIAAMVRAEVARVLGVDASRALDEQQGLFEMGMDSLMSVELKGRLESNVGHALPSTLTFNYPSIAALADYLLADLAAVPAQTIVQPATPTREVASVKSTVDHEDLSEDELAEMLAAKLAKIR